MGRGEPRVAAAGAAPPATIWQRGRFDAARGRAQVLFGRVYEDPAIERAALPAGGPVFCIASAGDMAIALAADHDVVAVDINPAQLRYAAARIAGAPAVRGTAERVMGLGRALAPLVGWSRAHLRAFLELDDPAAQVAFWRAHLDTRRFRAAVDGLLSRRVLGAIYASPFLALLPAQLGPVMRARLARGLGRHPNRTNPHARALLAGELAAGPVPARAATIALVHADAAAYLEHTSRRFQGFALSNILDGVDAPYRRRLVAAIQRAAAPGAVVVHRSFGEPGPAQAGGDVLNRAADDRALLWGVVEARPVDQLAALAEAPPVSSPPGHRYW